MHYLQDVMAGLVPATQKRRRLMSGRDIAAANLPGSPRVWVAGTSPAMTIEK
jgi:hypothetical protein